MVRHVLAIVNPLTSLVHLSADEVERVFRCGIEAVDFRWPLQRHAQWRQQRGAVLDYAARARDCGLQVRIHFWAGTRAPDGTASANGRTGAADGMEMAEGCHEAQATVVGINSERDVWRGRRHGKVTYVHEGAIEYQDAFWTELYAHTTDVTGQYVGFVHPAAYYRNVQFPQWLRERTPMLGAMAYQSSYDALASKLDRAEEHWPEHRRAGWFGIGRLDGKKVIGNAVAIRRLVAERYAGLQEVVHYCGNDGAWRMLVTGRPAYPPVTAMVGMMLGDQRNRGVA